MYHANCNISYSSPSSYSSFSYSSPSSFSSPPLLALPDNIKAIFFTYLGKKDWNNLGCSHFSLQNLSKTVMAEASLLQNNPSSIEKTHLLALRVGFCVTKLNLLWKEGETVKELNSLFDMFPKLQELDLIACKPDDVALLRFLPSLQSLNLSHTYLKCVNSLNFPLGLRSLNLSNCCLLANVDLASFSELQSLDLSGCRQLEHVASSHLPPKLRLLNLSNCRGLESVELSNFSELQLLNFSGCLKLMKIYLSHLSELQSLDISMGRYHDFYCESKLITLLSCPKITTRKTIDALSKHMKVCFDMRELLKNLTK